MKLRTIKREIKSRSSWVDVYNETIALHKAKRLLGQQVDTDDGLEWRVKWGQRGAGLSGLLALISWVARQDIAFIVFASLILTFFAILYYKTFRL